MQHKAVQEFKFERADFERIRARLYDKAGIRLADSKDSLVYSRLARRLRALKLQTFDQYLHYLEKTPAEVEPFINALTTNLTSFFREPHHFSALAEFLKANKRVSCIWCTASSTGEEPYSIAMTVAETLGSFRTGIEIIASDIDSNVLNTARRGIYSADAADKLTTIQRQQFMYRGKGRNQGKVKVVPELQQMVRFKQINLTHNNWPVPDRIDVIFCRNVMIYFDKPTQLKILERMVRLLPPHGLYIAGHSENFNTATHLVRQAGKTMYRPVKEG